MWTYSVSEVASIVDGTVVGDGAVTVSGVFTDSRADGSEMLFVALRGENFDGHRFVSDAAQKGAKAALVTEPVAVSSLAQIVVCDTLQALTRLATHHRRRFNLKVAAITGSAGKTTTRTLLSGILGVSKKVHEPEKNFNNHIGVPLTMMKLDRSYDAAVFELGCSDFNEIGPLTKIVSPHVALITNVGPAHLEKLKNLEGVARAKGELFDELDADAIAIVNLDDPHISKMHTCAENRVTFSTGGASSDVMLLDRTPGPFGQSLTMKLNDTRMDVAFPLPGFHNAIDATAAAAAALAMGASLDDIKTGLASAKTRPGRFEIHDKNGVCVIDDTYNANPSSVAASLEVLAEMVPAAQRMAVLGDMLELGVNTLDAHRQIGRIAARLGLKKLFLFGAFADATKQGAVAEGMDALKIECSDNVLEIAKKVVEISKSGDALLIKGSRGMKLERVVCAILEG
ncbi:MAG: UDP-N-acetylmuramoyl-tripeptide--D-alanyl-D-alanine ligase [Deltaproteobacteria bacterium]|nr:UDP-N-acetylmuramoyl-tripeptide--D-alanyl-D-alanine ligase [Deltaproteobacteria bacterium]